MLASRARDAPPIGMRGVIEKKCHGRGGTRTSFMVYSPQPPKPYAGEGGHQAQGMKRQVTATCFPRQDSSCAMPAAAVKRPRVVEKECEPRTARARYQRGNMPEGSPDRPAPVREEEKWRKGHRFSTRCRPRQTHCQGSRSLAGWMRQQRKRLSALRQNACQPRPPSQRARRTVRPPPYAKCVVVCCGERREASSSRAQRASERTA